MTTGTGQGKLRLQWMRRDVTGVSVEGIGSSVPAALRLELGGQRPASLLRGVDPRELRWIAGQIRNKWGGDPRS
jgi:hypothetical protein